MRVQCVWFRVLGSGFRVHGSGFRVHGSGFRVQGSGFRVQGSGFRVEECRPSTVEMVETKTERDDGLSSSSIQPVPVPKMMTLYRNPSVLT